MTGCAPNSVRLKATLMAPFYLTKVADPSNGKPEQPTALPYCYMATDMVNNWGVIVDNLRNDGYAKSPWGDTALRNELH